MQKTSQDIWLESALGQSLLGYEQAQYAAAVGDKFGFFAVQVGLPQIDTLANSRIPNIMRADIAKGDLYCQSDYLPFAENCIDLLCLPHALEFSENPHQTLREAARILVPEGHLIMTGFNPISAWGVKHFFVKRDCFPWNGDFFAISRIKDWLALLGLELVEVHFGCYKLPFNDEKWLNYFSFVDKIGEKWCPVMGGSYFIVAKKRVVNMTLLKPNWKQNPLKSRLVVNNPKKTKPTQKTNKKNII